MVVRRNQPRPANVFQTATLPLHMSQHDRLQADVVSVKNRAGQSKEVEIIAKKNLTVFVSFCLIHELI